MFGDHKVVHEEWDRYSPAMLHRCDHDVTLQVRIDEYLSEEGRGEGWDMAHRLNMKLFHYLQLQEEYGWLIDQPALTRGIATLGRWMGKIDRAIAPHLPVVLEVQEAKKQGEWNWVKKPFLKSGALNKRIQTAYTTLEHSYIGGPFTRIKFRSVDLDKAKEVKQFLLDTGWMPTEWNTDSNGKRTTPKLSKDDPFEGINGKLGKLIVRRVQCKQRRGTLEGWAGLVREDGRIASQVAGIATTGRLRHKGIVNVPSPHSNAFFSKQMRKMFTSKEGFVIVGVDSKGNQVRQLAARMGDDEFTHAVLHGKKEDKTDIHNVNMQKTGVPSLNLAKNFFYGFLFGAGDAKIGKIVGGKAAEGKRLKETYLDGLPKLRALIDRITEEWRETATKVFNKRTNQMEWRNGYIIGLDGRPIQVDSEHKLLVFYLQSDEAIQMAAAFVWFHTQMERRGWRFGIDYGTVIWMHDEYQIECRETDAQRVAAIACESIAWAGRFYNIACPHEGEAQIGENWFETH
jgi:hypothetical protein